MRGGNWLRSPVIAVVLICLVGLGLVALANSNRGADGSARQETNQFIVSPDGAGADAQVERAEQRAEEDLQAQKAMVVWAAAMALVTIVGVILLGFTLNETRRASVAAGEILSETRKQAEAAAKTYVMAHRTWVRVTASEASVEFADNNLRLTVMLTAENIGRYPALEVHLACKPIAGRSGARQVHELVASEIKLRSRAGGAMPGSVLLPGDQPFATTFTTDVENPTDKPPQVINIAFVALYRSLASNDWHHIAQMLIVRRKGGGSFDSEIGVVPTDKIVGNLVPGWSSLA